jgi:hypothetical protein
LIFELVYVINESKLKWFTNGFICQFKLMEIIGMLLGIRMIEPSFKV